MGFSLRWLLLLRSLDSHAGVVHGLSYPHGIWNLPGPGLEPVLPTLAGRFLTTGPLGKYSLADF